MDVVPNRQRDRTQLRTDDDVHVVLLHQPLDLGQADVDLALGVSLHDRQRPASRPIADLVEIELEAPGGILTDDAHEAGVRQQQTDGDGRKLGRRQADK